MKRFISLFLMTVAFGVTTTLAQDNDGKYTLQNGERTMVIDAAKGGKILSLKYGEREVISQLRWPEAFGSTFWTSPQKEWNWPPVPESAGIRQAALYGGAKGWCADADQRGVGTHEIPYP